MMTKIRKWGLAVCLTVCIILCSALGLAFMKDPSEAFTESGIQTFAATEDVTETITAASFAEGVTYESAEGVCYQYVAANSGFSVTGHTDGCTDAYIPDTLTISVSGTKYTYPVVRIEDRAFKSDYDITYIRIGRYVEYVGAGAFYYNRSCTGLDYFAENAVSGGITSYDETVCPFGYVGYRSQECDIFIGEMVEIVPECMFMYCFCSSLTFSEGSHLTEIGTYAFYNMLYANKTVIPEIRIPDTVETIGDSAFDNIYAEIEAFYIPESLKNIGTEVFGLWNVDNIYYNAVSLPDCDSKAEIFHYTGRDYKNTSNGFTVYIGKNVTRIPSYLFYSGQVVYVKEVSFVGDDDGGFALESIGEYAFGDCKNMTSVTLPMGVETIEPYAFSGCTALTSVTLGDTDGWYVTDANGDRLSDQTQVLFTEKYMSDASTVATYLKSSYADYCYHYTDGFTYSLSSDGTYYSVTGYVGDGGGVTINNTHRAKPVREIGAEAFKNETAITSVIIPESVTAIGSSAFSGCTSLVSVTIQGEGLEKVGEDAFEGCTALTSLYVYDTAAFVSADYDGKYANPLALVSSNGGNFYVGGTSYTTLTLSGTDRIGAYALAYCTVISDIVIGSSVETIGGYAFYGNTSIKSVTVPSNVTDIGAYAFGSMSLEALTLEISSGWTATSGSTSKSFQASELQLGNALTYLTSTYVSCVWTRKAVTTAAPTIDCSIDDYGYTNGSIFIATGVDANCTILYIYYTDPSGETHCEDGATLKLSTGLIEGMYVFWAVDSEMSESEKYHITYDATSPEIYATGSDVWDGYVESWGGYVESRFSVYARDDGDLSPVTLYYSRDGEAWTSCGGDSFSVTPSGDSGNDGKYWFAAEDAAGNPVGAYWIVLDTLTPDGKWELTDDLSLYFTWDAPSYTTWTCTVNGEPYTKGATYRKETEYTAVLTSLNGEECEFPYTLGHDWGDGEYIEPTCQEDGYWKYTCVYCGRTETVVDEFSSSGDHNYVLEFVEPTCTESGYSQYVCTDCKAVTEYTFYAALGHLWSNSDVSIPASCTENGYIGQVCTRGDCGAYNEYGEVLPATGHNFVNDEDFYIEAKCETRGQEREICTNCGEVRNTVYTAELGHLLVTESHTATCTTPGYSKSYCTREGCGYESTDDGDQILAAHSWSSDPYNMVSSTCEGEGYVIYVCEVCGEKETVTLSPSGHTWVYAGDTTIEGSDGEETVAFLYECSKCGATKVEAYTDAKAAGNAVTEFFKKYQKYIWWILLALVVVWSLFIGLRWALQRNDQERAKTRSMLANYVLGLFVIAVIVVGLPYLVYGIALLAG